MRKAITRALPALLAVLGLVGCKNLNRHNIEEPCLYGGPPEVYKDIPADSVDVEVDEPQQETPDANG